MTLIFLLFLNFKIFLVFNFSERGIEQKDMLPARNILDYIVQRALCARRGASKRVLLEMQTSLWVGRLPFQVITSRTPVDPVTFLSSCLVKFKLRFNMTYLNQPDYVRYLCNCGSLKPISKIYFCRHCLMIRCGYCVCQEVRFVLRKSISKSEQKSIIEFTRGVF